jgi:hypothetical protein
VTARVGSSCAPHSLREFWTMVKASWVRTTKSPTEKPKTFLEQARWRAQPTQRARVWPAIIGTDGTCLDDLHRNYGRDLQLQADQGGRKINVKQN